MAAFEGSAVLERALVAVGEHLRAGGQQLRIVIVGGAALNLGGMVRRTTVDVDVIALAHETPDGQLRLAPPEPFPEALRDAIRLVARDYQLPEDWLNAQVGKQWQTGLPPWIPGDLTWRTYGALEVGLVGRRTLLALKLFAAVDCYPQRSVHLQDLEALAPTPRELEEAADWVRTQDASPEFAKFVQQVIRDVCQGRG